MQNDANDSASQEDINLIVEDESGKESPQDEQVNLGVDDTTNQKNDANASGSEQENVQSQTGKTEPKADKSQRQITAQLGEEKKQVVKDLLDSALESDIVADKVKERMENDSTFKHYVKSKFGSYYDELAGDDGKSKKDNVDIEEIRREERLKAEADIKYKQIEDNKAKLIKLRAEQYGFNSAEYSQFEEYVDLLSKGKNISDEEVLFKKAALLVNQNKATAISPSSISDRVEGGSQESPGTVKELKISRRLYDYALEKGEDPKKLAKELSNLKGIGETNTFKIM